MLAGAPRPMGDNVWLTPAETAAFLKVSLSTVRGRIRDGMLPARRLKGSRLIRISRVAAEALLVEPCATQSDGGSRP